MRLPRHSVLADSLPPSSPMAYPASGSLLNVLLTAMTPDVIPVSIPTIDFKNLINYSVNFLGRPISKGVDAARINPEGYAAYLRILHAFKTGQDGSGVNSNSLWGSLFFGFLIHSSRESIAEITSVCKCSRVVALERDTAIITQDLASWWLILVEDNTYWSIETQQVMNQIYQYLIKFSLKLWPDFECVYRKDKTFNLVHR